MRLPEVFFSDLLRVLYTIICVNARKINAAIHNIRIPYKVLYCPQKAVTYIFRCIIWKQVSSQKNCSYVHKFLVAGLFHDLGKENYMFKFVK